MTLQAHVLFSGLHYPVQSYYSQARGENDNVTSYRLASWLIPWDLEHTWRTTKLIIDNISRDFSNM